MTTSKRFRLPQRWLVLSAICFCVGTAHADKTTRVSIGSNDEQGNGDSDFSGISANGRYIAFSSRATNLVPDDTNQKEDVFVRDQYTGTTTRVSVGFNNSEANNSSFGPSISANGRYVAFSSQANNLVAGSDTTPDGIFVFDRQTGTTTRVSVASDGTPANGASYTPVISAGGRYIGFTSRATNLVPNDTNGAEDIFVYDRLSATTERVSVSTEGAQTVGAPGLPSPGSSKPSISADGRYVAFWSIATNLVPNDTNRVNDIFVRDRQNRTTIRVSVTSTGQQSSGATGSDTPVISANGRCVAFITGARNLAEGYGPSVIVVHDQHTKETKRLNLADTSFQERVSIYVSAISADGRFVVFNAEAPNLVEDDTNNVRDVFVHDRETGTTKRVSVARDGTQANKPSHLASISADGRYVAFTSEATNLVPADTNEVFDVFVHDLNGNGFSALAVTDARTRNEGHSGSDGYAMFTLSLSNPNLQAVTVTYKTVDGTAKAGEDYVANASTLIFAPGETSKTVRVNFIGDSVAETHEKFFLDIAPVGDFPIADSRGTAYIRNDDGPGISIANAKAVVEGNSGTTAQTFSIALSSPSIHTVTVDWSTVNASANAADYRAATGTVTFAPGETFKTIVVQVNGDATVERTELYRVNLVNPKFAVIADSQASGYILNDDHAPTLVNPEDSSK